ncbi:hypothetical protein ALP8811_01010 [Aliiroseovarius pelagivivens]|uniref:DUF2924 domain-containing protein n=1 Tax=Aliiroseovarius pelagivivens TaxID=1639690 RepID=A0A2R8AJI4_9RHOB|nr:DUF2924 domain-containing protein [Aliiroseovarius pelagivivens]SPF76014.1 hypothetical protein ALP8811_01010 [Aliiroseovarius pelagivivens]
MLREIATLDRGQCQLSWRRAFKSDPPRYLSIPFMQRVLAHDLQCRKLGGLSAANKRVLKAVLAGGDANEAVQNVGEGATLVREWNGRVYRVQAVSEGYVLDGKTYRSLSAVARHITSAHWSGPRFFGLTQNRSA